MLDGEANRWGQRIDVDSWKYYNPAGIWVNTDNYVGGTVYDTIREISEDEGKRLDKFLSEEHEYSVENENYADNDKEAVNHFPFADD